MLASASSFVDTFCQKRAMNLIVARLVWVLDHEGRHHEIADGPLFEF